MVVRNSKKFMDGDTVKVVSLTVPTRQITGSQGVMRQPAVGDIAEIYSPAAHDEFDENEAVEAEYPEEPKSFTVQMVENDLLVWSATFTPEEIERVVEESGSTQ